MRARALGTQARGGGGRRRHDMPPSYEYRPTITLAALTAIRQEHATPIVPARWVHSGTAEQQTFLLEAIRCGPSSL